jgi:hypothetical protein
VEGGLAGGRASGFGGVGEVALQEGVDGGGRHGPYRDLMND